MATKKKATDSKAQAAARARVNLHRRYLALGQRLDDASEAVGFNPTPMGELLDAVIGAIGKAVYPGKQTTKQIATQKAKGVKAALGILASRTKKPNPHRIGEG